MARRHDKGASAADKRKMAAEKKRQQAEKLRQMQNLAYNRAYKSAILQQAKAAGRRDGLKAASKPK